MPTAASHQALDRGAVREVPCCIAGCGPAGAMLGFLLARAGVDVLVLEKHDDFFRDFRGDTIHPSTLEVIDELGLAERFAAVPQQHVSRLGLMTDDGAVPVADFAETRLRFPYIAFVPQWDFLDFLTDAAKEYPGFALRMGAEVCDLLRRDGRVAGVRYRSDDGVHDVQAELTVAADGRDSAVRRLAELEPISYGAPMDVLWFRLSRVDGDPDESFGRISPGRFMAFINRGSYWQVAYLIRKGSDVRLRAQDIDALRAGLAEARPLPPERFEAEPASWDEVRTLEVQVNRLRRWHRPGLLCIGDAAHAMSPVGGVGINLAIQDAVAAANALAEPLLRGTLGDRALARVQRRRWFPTFATQLFQRVVQRRLLEPVLEGGGSTGAPAALRRLRRVPLLRRLPGRLIGTGVLPEHVRSPAHAPARRAHVRASS